MMLMEEDFDWVGCSRLRLPCFLFRLHHEFKILHFLTSFENRMIKYTHVFSDTGSRKRSTVVALISSST